MVYNINSNNPISGNNVKYLTSKISRSLAKAKQLKARNEFYFLRCKKFVRKLKIVEPHMNAHTIGIIE